jgi:poly-beta-1,6-N-acetyl-D-glucosamine synthase
MRAVFQGLFWLSAVTIAYAYVGYPILIALLARWRGRPVRQEAIEPTVTVLVAAYNEQDCIANKIENTLSQDYAPERLSIAIVSDGSTDRTNEIVEGLNSERVRLLYQPTRQGKVGALLRAMPLTESEIVVFSDANSIFPSGTIRMLIRNFADPEVGAASGAKRMLAQGDQVAGQGEGLYWRYESFLKRCDSAVSSVMGVPGEIWAARRIAYVPPDAGSLLDDFVASLRMVAAGWRVVYDPDVFAYEEASPSLSAEWQRRARNAAGGWQAFFQLKPLLRHPNRLIPWQYLSHRMLRWMVVPMLMILLLLSNCLLLDHPFYRWTLAVQIVFYLVAALGWFLTAKGRRINWLLAPFYICMLNGTALAGGWRFVRGRQSVIWKKVR